MSGGNLTRIKNNQITDATIWANAKIIPGSIVGSLFSSNITVTSDFVITGNLTVQGASTYLTVASTNTYVNDPLIVLNNAFTGANSYDLGFIFNRGSSPNKSFYWDESSTEFRLITTTETGTTYGSIAEPTNYEKLHLGNLVADYDVSTKTITATGLINTTGNVSGAVLNGGAINSTGLINTTGNVSGAVLNGGAINSTGLINTTGNVSAAIVIAGQFNTTGNLSASQVSTATLNATGLINTTANISAAVVNTGALNATGTTTLAAVNSSGFINTTGNISGAVVNTGALNATGTVTLTGFLNSSANISAAVLNGGAINSTGLINTTANISAAVVNAGALNATGTTTLAAVNSSGFINTTANVSAAVVNAGALNATGTTTLAAVNSSGFLNSSANISAAVLNGGAINSTGLINTTGNVSAAVVNAGQFNTSGNLSATEVSTQTLKSSALTSGRVVFTGTGGLLVSNAGITFSANTLTVGGAKPITINGTTATIATTGTNQNLTLAPNGSGVVDFNATYATNLHDPVSNSDAVTLGYLNTRISTGVTTLISDNTDWTVTDDGVNPGLITGNVDGISVQVITSDLFTLKKDVLVSNATTSTSTTTGALRVSGGVGVAGNITVGGNIKATDVTQSTSTTTGAIITAGGLGVAKNLTVGGDATITGNLTVQGRLTAIQSTTLDVTDVQITLAKGAGSSAAADGAGINVDYGNVGANITYTHATTSWNFNRAVIGSSYANFSGNVLATNFVGGGVNISGNVLAASAVLGSLTVNGTVTNQGVNASGNIVATGGIFNALTVNGNITSTGLINTTGNVSAATVIAGQFNTTGNLVASQVSTGTLNATGLINTTANISAVVINTGALNSTGLINTTGNISGAVVNAGAINSTGLINTTANISAAVVNTGALNSTGLINTTGNISAALVIAGQFNTTGNILSAGAILNALTVNGTAGVTTLNATTLTATGNVIGGLASFASINATPIGNATASSGAFTSLAATGTIYANATTSSNTATSGALVVAGAVGIGGNLILSGSSNIIAGGSNGTSGQYLIATGTGVQWSTLVAGATIAQGASNVTVTANYVNVAINSGNVAVFRAEGLSGAIGAYSANTAQFTTLSASQNVTFNNYTGYLKAAGGSPLSASGTIPNTDITGLGTMSTQNSTSISVTGGSINGTTVGASTASSGKFTTLEATQTGLFNSAQGVNTFTIKGVSDAALFVVTPSATGGLDGVVINGAGNTTPSYGAGLKVGGTGAIQIPYGSTAQRPGSSGNVDLVGMVRYNTTSNNLEFCTAAGAPGTYTPAGSIFTTISTNAFSGNGVQTVYTLSSSSTTAGTIVMVNGIVQIPTTAYSVTGTALTFTEAPATGDAIDARVITTTATVSQLASGNGYDTFDVSSATYANITAGTSSATVRMSIDGATGTATFTNDVVVNGNLTVKGGSSGNINIGDQTTDKVQLQGTIIYDQTALTAIGTNLQQLDSFSTNAYHTAKYLIQIRDGSNIESAEVLLAQDGTNVSITTYAVLAPGGTLGTFQSNISAGTVRWFFTPSISTYANIKVQTTYIV